MSAPQHRVTPWVNGEAPHLSRRGEDECVEREHGHRDDTAPEVIECRQPRRDGTHERPCQPAPLLLCEAKVCEDARHAEGYRDGLWKHQSREK